MRCEGIYIICVVYFASSCIIVIVAVRILFVFGVYYIQMKVVLR